MTIRQILEEKGREVATMDPGVTMLEATEFLSEKRIGAAIILKGETIAGILSERDIVKAIARSGVEVLDRPISGYMTEDVKTCTETDTVESVMDQMTDGRFRHLPVVNGTRLIGIISIGDVVKRRIRQAQLEAESLKQYIAS